MSGQIMRELKPNELKEFGYFLKGYRKGLQTVAPREVKLYNRGQTFTGDTLEAYKEAFKWFARSKKKFYQFKKGFVSGYFTSISNEKPFEMQDPYRNDDIYEYLKSVWLYERTYGATETDT